MRRTHSTDRTRTIRWAWGLAAVLLVAGLLASCSSDEPASDAGSGAVDETAADTTAPADTTVNQFDLVGGDYFFETDGVTELPAGVNRITFTVTEGSVEDHVAMLARIKRGNTIDEVLAAAAEDFTGRAAEPLVQFYGGVNALSAGQTQSSLVDLDPGEYVLGCFIPAQDGTLEPHSARGMFAPIEVPEPAAEPTEVESEGTLELSEMAFDLPDDFDGNGTFEVANVGEELHETGIVKLDDGRTGQEVVDYFDFTQGPPVPGEEPHVAAGGFGANHPGRKGYMELALDPGDYVLICFVTSQDFQTHLAQGMWEEFTVPGA